MYLSLAGFKKTLYLCTRKNKQDAQMAESVDALVSNTSRFTPVPVRPRLWVHKKDQVLHLVFFHI